MDDDRSGGWNDAADRFIAVRSATGAALVRGWARGAVPPGSTIVDVGCGSGRPIAAALIRDGFAICGIDAAPRLIAAFRRTCLGMPAACEAAQDSAFFGRRFAGAVAIGLLFLLDPDDQCRVLRRVADALEPGGRFLFSAPREACTWADSLTGRPSTSLGEAGYRQALAASGLRLAGCHVDEGGNHYFDAEKPSDPAGTAAPPRP